MLEAELGGWGHFLPCDLADPAGVTVCDAVEGAPHLEVCDGLDNNCDGSTDTGSNLGNGPGIQAEPYESHGRPASIRMTYPPLGVCVFKPRR